MDINKELKRESDNLPIRTTSQMILSRYEAKKAAEEEKSTKNKWWIPLSGGLVFACTAAAICAVVFIPKNKKPSYEAILEEELPLDDKSLVGQTGLQLFYGSQFTPKSAAKSNVKRSISINVSDMEARVENTYNGLYSTIHSFFGTNNKLALKYSKTDFTYQGESYPYVLIQGDSKVYTKNDIRNGDSSNIAVYQLGDETYQGYVYCDSDDNFKFVRSVFYSGSKKITIAQGSDEDGTGLSYRIVDTSNNSYSSESYLVAMDWSEKNPNSDFDECFIVHRTGLSLVKATTQYDVKKEQYYVDYFDIIFTELSGIQTNFSYQVNADGGLNYQFENN